MVSHDTYTIYPVCFSPFWDIVVVTAGDAEQQKSYEQQLQVKVERREIPGWIR